MFSAFDLAIRSSVVSMKIIASEQILESRTTLKVFSHHMNRNAASDVNRDIVVQRPG